jgi:tripartite-type tricarboxylate transporter receptor subunit TctC
MTRTFALALAFGFSVVAAASAQAPDYPQRNVTFICPFPAGGGTDILTRMLAQELQDKLRKTVIVENRPGAGTIVAAQAAARAAPDGHTIFIAPVTTLGIGPNVHKSLPYDTVKDFAPIGLVGSAQFALIANPSLGAKTLPELIALIKSRNGELSFASSGASTPHRLFLEMFLKMIDGKAQHVPYRGSVAALTDVISGQIPFMIVDLAVAMPAINEGKVRAYGVTSAQRVRAMPELPTIAEAGVPGYATVAWGGVIGPARLPSEIILKLHQEVKKALASPNVVERYKQLDTEPDGGTPEEFMALVKRETPKWAEVIRRSGAKVD